MMFDRTAWMREYRKKYPERIREYQRRTRQKNREKIRQSHRKWYATNIEEKRRKVMVAQVKKYGLTIEQYDKMIAVANGQCEICKGAQNLTRKGRILPLCVDHDHVSGKARGLLCHRCNSMIGHSGDSIHRLLAGAEYLRNHGRY